MCTLHLMCGAQARCLFPSPRGWESEHLESSVSVVEFCFPQSYKGEFPKYRMGSRFVILERMTNIHCRVMARIIDIQIFKKPTKNKTKQMEGKMRQTVMQGVGQLFKGSMMIVYYLAPQCSPFAYSE